MDKSSKNTIICQNFHQNAKKSPLRLHISKIVSIFAHEFVN